MVAKGTIELLTQRHMVGLKTLFLLLPHGKESTWSQRNGGRSFLLVKKAKAKIAYYLKGESLSGGSG